MTAHIHQDLFQLFLISPGQKVSERRDRDNDITLLLYFRFVLVPNKQTIKSTDRWLGCELMSVCDIYIYIVNKKE